MKKTDLLKGIGAGMAVGMLVGVLVVPKRKRCKTGVARALQSACELIDGISGAMGI